MIQRFAVINLRRVEDELHAVLVSVIGKVRNGIAACCGSVKFFLVQRCDDKVGPNDLNLHLGDLELMGKLRECIIAAVDGFDSNGGCTGVRVFAVDDLIISSNFQRIAVDRDRFFSHFRLDLLTSVTLVRKIGNAREAIADIAKILGVDLEGQGCFAVVIACAGHIDGSIVRDVHVAVISAEGIIVDFVQHDVAVPYCNVRFNRCAAIGLVSNRNVEAGNVSLFDDHNDFVGCCLIMIRIPGTDSPEGISADVQLCRGSIVYCIGSLTHLIVDRDIRADGDTVAVAERDGVAVRNRNCVFLVVDLQRQLACGFCDLEGRRNRALIFALAGRGQRRGADIDVVRIGQIIIDAVFKELFAKRDSRGGLDLIAVIVFEGTDSCNGSTADVSLVHNQVIGCRSLTIICNGNRVAIVVRNSQNRTIFRVSCVAAGNHVRIAASECRGNFKSIQIQRLTAGIF